ncbi:hypothetical protein LUZ60_008265 [Juncus effusus]|nr:hypothetical protein LUZ60_008265 [Juncus effusus]
MSDESERRIKKVMDKLYHFPKPNKSSSPSSSSGQRYKRTELDTRFGMQMGLRVPLVRTLAAPPPPCRPWDRADLMRRLMTFKAMTWFAKPKVISPVNCARRGWINIEVDVISCEACGARLLFSTPSSWSLEQVEKAALVFSLKLDSGHRLLCPWIDNTCEESLVHFPPTLPATLSQNYSSNLSSLSRLFYLPAISSSVIQYLTSRAPQLEEFLKEKEIEGVLNGGIRVCEEEVELEGVVEDSDLYYQALKLISLCGWEPLQLPYTIDRVNSNSTGDPSTPPSSSSSSSSFTLHCSFCGARVALWTFKSLPRPLRLFTLVTNDNINSEDGGESVGGSSIGGGPVPSRRKFRPRVRFPVVSRSLKCDLGEFEGVKRKRGGSEEEGLLGGVESVVEKQKDDGNDEFDPVKQHRTFCPWISPEDNSEILPGWKLTFLALLSQEKEKEKEKDGEASFEEREKRNSLLDEEEEDPVVSVRRLFTTPPSKRLKLKSTP